MITISIMDIEKLIGRVALITGFVASLITISDHVSAHLNHGEKEQSISIPVDESSMTNPNDKPKERTYIGQLWHDAFSDEGISVKERWATRQERLDEVDGVFHRLAFGLFYFPIVGIIILLLSCIVAAMAATAILELDEKAGIIDGIIGAILGFVGGYIVLDGLYTILVWLPGRI